MKTEESTILDQKIPIFQRLPALSNFNFKMPKNPNLKLFTKTWPPKRDNNNKKDDRPLTATLEKPTILNINLIQIVDMSTVRKEFLNISNLCKFPLALGLKNINRKKTATIIPRPVSLPSPEKHKTKKKSEEDEEESVRSAKNKKEVKQMKKNDANNNNKTFKIPRKRLGNVVKILNVTQSDVKSTKLPEPCKTCGRPDQPERFHSHPATPMNRVQKKEDPPKMKSTVQKPVAMKYKSKQNEKKVNSPALNRKASLPAQKLVHSPPNKDTSADQNGNVRVKSAKRTLTCYICGREFGTASLHLHEPKCLQRWERENATLPTHLQNKSPVKPDRKLGSVDWNQKAWEASQANLAGCPSCGRTFNPDRLLVHQRICKINQEPSTPSSECYICGKIFASNSIQLHERSCLKKWHSENDCLPADIRAAEPIKPEVSTPRKSKMFPCYICGRLFTKNSVRIHEPQCLKMWKIENDKLPLHRKRPQPIKPDLKFTEDGKIDYEATNDANWQSHLSQLVPCRICGRTFNPERVEIHENSCKG